MVREEDKGLILKGIDFALTALGQITLLIIV
ncbi:hypothetical protein A2U01_0103669, partial [Trifolium medium]|nr:hypothetical protein [Trifolium medium]